MCVCECVFERGSRLTERKKARAIAWRISRVRVYTPSPSPPLLSLHNVQNHPIPGLPSIVSLSPPLLSRVRVDFSRRSPSPSLTLPPSLALALSPSLPRSLPLPLSLSPSPPPPLSLLPSAPSLASWPGLYPTISLPFLRPPPPLSLSLYLSPLSFPTSFTSLFPCLTMVSLLFTSL